MPNPNTATDDAAEEYKQSLALLSADELRAMKDGGEDDAIIDSILNGGKQVETKGSKSTTDDDDESSAAAAPAEKVALKVESDDDDDDDDDGGDDAEADKTKAAPAAAPDTTATDPVDPAATIEQAVIEIAPLNLGFLETEYAEKQKALDAEKSVKFKEMMEGIIDADAYSAYEAGYLNQRDQLRTDKATEAEWWKEVHAFKVEAATKNGINYETDTEKSASLDDWVKRLASKPENANQSGRWYLDQAHKKVITEFGIGETAAKAAPEAAKTVAPVKKVAEKTGRAPNLSAIPPTLGGLPVAAETDSGDGGEFAHLDKLTGMAFEQALARLTPDQKARYEAE